jgi:hypothetical protein
MLDKNKKLTVTQDGIQLLEKARRDNIPCGIATRPSSPSAASATWG